MSNTPLPTRCLSTFQRYSASAREAFARSSRRGPEQWQEAIRSLAPEFNKEGMTGLKDPGIGPEVWDAYQKVRAEGALTVRVFALWEAGDSVDAIRALIARVGPFTKPPRSTGDDHLVSGGIKLYMDGSGGARTAWLYDE